MRALVAHAHYWGSPFKVQAHFIAEALAGKGVEVLFISRPLSPVEFLLTVRSDPFWRFSLWLWGPRRVAPKIWAYQPFSPFPRPRRRYFEFEGVAERHFELTVPRTRAVLRKAGFLRPEICVVSDPFFLSLIKVARPVVTVYFMADLHVGFPGYPRWADGLERRVAATSDIIAFPSPLLLRRAREVAREGAVLLLLRRWVDTRPFERRWPVPAEYEGIPRPRAVHVGRLSPDQLDYRLLTEAALSLPEVSFVLIGPPPPGGALSVRAPNIFFLGPRKPPCLPPYLVHADVAVIPWRRSPQLEVTVPVKLFQFMAAGLPVVSVRTAGLETTGFPILFANTPEEFAKAVREALRRKEELGRRMREIAKEHTPEAGFEPLWRAILQVARKKGVKIQLAA